MKTLLIYRPNYADEFELESFSIVPKDYWTQIQKLFNLLNPNEEYEISFGTNEYIITTIKDFYSDLVIQDIFPTESDKIEELIGDEFGVLTPSSVIDYILEVNSEEHKEIEEFLDNVYFESTEDLDG